MANLLLSRTVQKIGQKCHLRSIVPAVVQQRNMTHYPIDDIVSGLTEEQIMVPLKLKESKGKIIVNLMPFYFTS